MIHRGFRRLLLLGLLVAAGCAAMDSPRDRARKAVERSTEAGVSIPLPSSGTIEIPPGAVEVLAMDAYATERGALEGFGQLSLEGRVGEVALSYLGNEKMAFRCSARRCELEGPLASRLIGVVDALVRRKEALEAEDLGALARLAARPEPITPEEVERAAEREIAAWYIRVESGSAIVGEADEAGAQRRMHLREGEDGWRFVGGLL